MRNQQTWTRARPEIQGNSYITEECNTTKTTRPLPRTPAKISQTALQTPCCSTALSDCAEKRSSFFSQLLERIGLKYQVSQVSLMPGWSETHFTFTLAERFLNELRHWLIYPQRLAELKQGRFCQLAKSLRVEIHQLYMQTHPATRAFQVNLTLETEPKVPDN